jgi:glycosyltransferase involved in cell wall biosynthesis
MIKFSIVTPCLNAESYIQETIESVINQSAIQKGLARLEFIICDGGSKDKTVQIAENVLKKTVNCDYKILSGKDKGMYDAISKGFKVISGDYYAYINAGDIYSPYAFEIILEVFKNPTIKWATGIRVLLNESSQVIGARLPYKYRKSFIRKGYYGRFLPFIQQESTFWRSELNSLIDINYFSSLHLAGDYYLWKTFAKKNHLYIIQAFLGGFKIHRGQQSENAKAYKKELRQFARSNFLLILIDLPMIIVEGVFFLTDYYKTKLNKSTMITFDHGNNRWKTPDHS